LEQEYRVLTHLQNNDTTTQRYISSRTGLSLGAVNLLIKKMVKKGLIKIERLNPRTVRYILTPKGLEEKARLSYRYIRQSYRQLLKINRAMDSLLAEKKDGETVVLFGPNDEIREILTQYLSEQNISYQVFSEEAESEKVKSASAGLTLTWREEEENSLEGKTGSVNIMKVV